MFDAKETAPIFNTLKKVLIFKGNQFNRSAIIEILNKCNFPKGCTMYMAFINSGIVSKKGRIFSFTSTDPTYYKELEKVYNAYKALVIRYSNSNKKPKQAIVLTDEMCIRYLKQRGYKIIKEY